MKAVKIKEERRNYDAEFIERLTRIETKVDNQTERLDKINGTVADYNANKYKMNLACEKAEAIEKDIEKNIKPPLTKLTIKIYSLAILTGLFSGGIGTLAGYWIAKLAIVSIGGA